MSELESHGEIAAHAERLLYKAGAAGRFPTPVDDIIAAANLVEPSESLLSDHLISQAPAHIRDKIARLASRVRGLVDRRALEVHLSPEITVEGRRRFVRLHEVVHHILPWQVDLGYADDDRNLAGPIEDKFELEASDGAAELLFQGHRFAVDVADLEIGLPAVIAGHDRFGSSLRAALRRYPEEHRASVMSVVLDVSPLTVAPLRYRRHELTMSSSFAARFGDGIRPSILSQDAYPFVVVAAAAATSSIVISDECGLTDRAGDPVTVRVDALNTGYDLLVLVWVPIKERTRKRVRLAA